MTPEGFDAELAARLRERGLRVTSSRLVIHRALRERASHVTAEEVRDAVAGALPGTSLPTVYATLDLFEELGIVRRVHAGRGAVLYDPRTEPHHHTLCRRCGRVADLESGRALEGALRTARTRARAGGFEAEDAALVVSGLCADCRG